MSITWNGVSSDTIGVIVERIPNRYVPTRRFSPQQVAGRNGNILLVDKSFPNVEQEYEVYLSAEAQGLPSVARACAEWLMGPDGYCRLEDSYDTTVYREAFLMGGYDLENILNKFGRCTITFSCKPQKYLLTGDTPIEIPAGITTYTGDVVQFDGVTGASITSLSTTITPTQDLHGYDHPWPAGGGKNICPPDGWEQGQIQSDGTINSVSYAVSSPYILLAGGQTYTLSRNYQDYGDGQMAYHTYDLSKRHLSGSGWRPNNYAFTPESDCYIRITTRAKPQNQNPPALTPNDVGTMLVVQLERGSTATSYSPCSNICPISGRTGLSVYVSPTTAQADATTYSVDWTSQAGTVYGGTLDVVTGVLTVDRAMVDLGTLTWGFSTTADNVKCYYSNDIRTLIKPVASHNDTPDMISSKYQTFAWNSRLSVTNGISLISSGLLMIIDSNYQSESALSDFTASLSGVQLCYKLATPLTYQLTAQEIEVLIGTNNVWSSSGDVSVTVVTPLGGIVTNPTPFEARPMLEVSGVGEITINGKSIQILESVSDFQIDCEAMEAEDNSKIYCMDFPELSGGENEIVGDGSITAMTVTPRWWTL